MTLLASSLGAMWKAFASTPSLKAAAGIAGGIAAFFFPTETLENLAIGAGALVLADTVTGVWAAYQSGQPIRSSKFARLISKVVGYGGAFLVARVVERNTPSTTEIEPVLSAALLSAVIATEGWSVLENARKMGLKLPSMLTNALKGEDRRGG